MSTCSQTISGEDISYCVIYRPVSFLWLCTISHDKLSKMNICTHLYSDTIKFESYTSTWGLFQLGVKQEKICLSQYLSKNL